MWIGKREEVEGDDLREVGISGPDAGVGAKPIEGVREVAGWLARSEVC